MNAARMPAWAAAGTFAHAWRSAADDVWTSYLGFESGALQDGLSNARVVAINKAQVDALPSFRNDDAVDESALYASELTLPFPAVYLSLDYAHVRGRGREAQVAGVYLEQSDGHEVYGDRIAGVPFLYNATFPSPRAGGLMPGPFTGVHHGHEDGWRWASALTSRMKAAYDSDPDVARAFAGWVNSAMHRAAAVLYLLEAVNVELVPGQASRQERRQVQRDGGEVALTVHIRTTSRRRVLSTPSVQRDYSHRFEVRGYYKHVTRGRHAKPEFLKPCSRCGSCRREWVPPHVKGPENKPFVPKVRLVG